MSSPLNKKPSLSKFKKVPCLDGYEVVLDSASGHRFTFGVGDMFVAKSDFSLYALKLELEADDSFEFDYYSDDVDVIPGDVLIVTAAYPVSPIHLAGLGQDEDFVNRVDFIIAKNRAQCAYEMLPEGPGPIPVEDYLERVDDDYDDSEE